MEPTSTLPISNVLPLILALLGRAYFNFNIVLMLTLAFSLAPVRSSPLRLYHTPLAIPFVDHICLHLGWIWQLPRSWHFEASRESESWMLLLYMNPCPGLPGERFNMGTFGNGLAKLLMFDRPEGNLRCCAYSPCGNYFAWASPERYVGGTYP